MTNTPPPPKGGMPKWLIVLLVIFLIIILGCCGGFVTCTYFLKKGVEAAPAFIDKVVKEGAPRLAKEIARQNGIELHMDSELPSNFPKDIPISPNLTPTQSGTKTTTGEGIVYFNGKGKGKDIADFYQSEMDAKGWKLD